jgi:hypothetical protein
MKMIAHQTIRVNLPLCLAASLSQGTQKPLPVCLVPENVLTPVAAIHHVINRPLIFHSQFARHEQISQITPLCVNSKD